MWKHFGRQINQRPQQEIILEQLVTHTIIKSLEVVNITILVAEIHQKHVKTKTVTFFLFTFTNVYYFFSNVYYIYDGIYGIDIPRLTISTWSRLYMYIYVAASMHTSVQLELLSLNKASNMKPQFRWKFGTRLRIYARRSSNKTPFQQLPKNRPDALCLQILWKWIFCFASIYLIATWEIELRVTIHFIQWVVLSP